MTLPPIPDGLAPDAPPMPSAGAWPPPPPPRRRARWVRWVVVTGVLLGLVALVGSIVELPYYTIAPGSTLDMTTRIEVDGATSYDSDGEVLLLFVRQNARVNVWEWLEASVKDDIDLFEEEDFTGGQSPEEVRAGAEADMARSQIAAKKTALEALGYEVPLAEEGVEVLAVLPGRPADGRVEPGDVILAADGRPIISDDTLGTVIGTKRPGESVRLGVLRAGDEQAIDVPVEMSEEGTPIIGVFVVRQYDFPVDVSIDTSDIGGPSAGLAMTLAVIDELTPGELTGGKRVAVTGTIEEDGTVGEIGGIGQKAVAARAADADVMLVPASEAAEARARAGSMEVVGVEDLDDALQALRDVGGAEVSTVALAA